MVCANSKGSDHTVQMLSLIWLGGYKTFFMLISAEHEILNAHKYNKTCHTVTG